MLALAAPALAPAPAAALALSPSVALAFTRGLAPEAPCCGDVFRKFSGTFQGCVEYGGRGGSDSWFYRAACSKAKARKYVPPVMAPCSMIAAHRIREGLGALLAACEWLGWVKRTFPLWG